MFECRKLALSLSAPSSLACGTEMLFGTGPPVGAFAPPETSGWANDAGAVRQRPAKTIEAAQARGRRVVPRMAYLLNVVANGPVPIAFLAIARVSTIGPTAYPFKRCAAAS